VTPDDVALEALLASPLERLRRETMGGLAYELEGASRAPILEAWSAPERQIDDASDVSDAIDLLQIDTSSFEHMPGQETVRVNVSEEFSLAFEELFE
jgi:hypothetical protein